jgi:hypothetical protein
VAQTQLAPVTWHYLLPDDVLATFGYNNIVQWVMMEMLIRLVVIIKVLVLTIINGMEYSRHGQVD